MNDEYGRDDNTFLACGGEKGVYLLSLSFYRIMFETPAFSGLASLHAQSRHMSSRSHNVNILAERLGAFLCGWMGGPKRYSQRYGSINIPSAHAHLPVTSKLAKDWLDCMDLAMQERKYPEPLTEYLRSAFSVPAQRIVQRVQLSRQ